MFTKGIFWVFLSVWFIVVRGQASSSDTTKGVPTGPCYIINKLSGTVLALDPSGTITQDGTKVQSRTLNGIDSQQWVFEPSTTWTGYAIKNVASGTYLGFMPGQQADTNIPVTGNSQKVVFDVLGEKQSGYWLIPTYRPTLALGLPSGATASGTNISYLSVNWGNSEQRWRILSIPDI